MVAYVYPRRLTRREYSGARGLRLLPSLRLCLWRAPHTHGCPATVAASTAAARPLDDGFVAPAAVGLARRWGGLFGCGRGRPAASATEASWTGRRGVSGRAIQSRAC